MRGLPHFPYEIIKRCSKLLVKGKMMSEKKYTTERANQFIREEAGSVNQYFRPQVHFTAPIGWINDPNGLVYFQGAYHLFYQFYPYDSVWGPMHWGHARSTDLIHWEHLPVALAPDMPYDKDGCFSGSAIVKDDTLWLMYTGNVMAEDGTGHQIQNMAFSKDGIHFEKLATNPVLTGDDLPAGYSKPDFRDPKVFEKDGIYYSVIVSQHVDKVGAVLLFKSADLKKWEFASVFLKGLPEQGFMWECPDYFHLDGKDVLILSPMNFQKSNYDYANINSSVVMTGTVDWDKLEFQMETVKEIDHGQDFYAPQTLVDPQDRRIMIAWQQMWNRNIPSHELGHKWAGSMTFPRQLRMVDGQLQQDFILEKAKLLPVSKGSGMVDLEEKLDRASYLSINGEAIQNLTLSLGKVGDAISLTYADGLLSLDRRGLALAIKGEEETSVEKRSLALDKLTSLEIIIDINTIDILVNNGSESLSSTFYIEGEKVLSLKTKEATYTLSRFNM